MSFLAPKRTTETKRYVLDWTDQLGDDEITDAALAVTAGTVTISETDFSGTQVAALIAGGASGETATLTLTIKTTAGQVLARDYSLRVSASAVSPFPSTSTKGQIEDMAFEEIGLAGYAFDASPDEQASGLRRLDSLMAQWAGPGMNLDLGYNFPAAVGGSDRADPSGIPDMALDAVVLKLALSIAPGIGKNLSVETRTRMNEGMRAVRAALAVIPTVSLPAGTVRGAGAKPSSTWRPFNSGNA